MKDIFHRQDAKIAKKIFSYFSSLVASWFKNGLAESVATADRIRRYKNAPFRSGAMDCDGALTYESAATRTPILVRRSDSGQIKHSSYDPRIRILYKCCKV